MVPSKYIPTINIFNTANDMVLTPYGSLSNKIWNVHMVIILRGFTYAGRYI